MILLDTNVVSEAMKPRPNPAVLAWLDAQITETLYLSSITLAELLFGIGSLPIGRRKTALTQVLSGLLDLFGDRMLTFDTAAARHYADLAVAARAAGQGFPTPDDYMLSFLFLRYLSDNYAAAAKKELGADYPQLAADDRRPALSVWYTDNAADTPAFETQMRRKVHYVSTAQAEPDIDLAAVHTKLRDIDEKIAKAAEEHNGYLRELGLPPV